MCACYKYNCQSAESNQSDIGGGGQLPQTSKKQKLKIFTPHLIRDSGLDSAGSE